VGGYVRVENALAMGVGEIYVVDVDSSLTI